MNVECKQSAMHDSRYIKSIYLHETERMQFYDRHKRSKNCQIWKIKAHTSRVAKF